MELKVQRSRGRKVQYEDTPALSILRMLVMNQGSGWSFAPHEFHLTGPLAVWPHSSHYTSLSFSFLFCRQGH